MKLYLSFGIVKDDGTSERLFYLDQQIDQSVIKQVITACRGQLGL